MTSSRPAKSFHPNESVDMAAVVHPLFHASWTEDHDGVGNALAVKAKKRGGSTRMVV